jgi:hypothetical protein
MINLLASPTRSLARLGIIGAMFVTAGCAHPVSVRPDINYPSGQTVDTSVGYFISDANRKLEVTTPAGGGDKIRYFPYRDMEPAILSTLGSVFHKVYSVPETGRTAYVTDHHLTFVFEPILTTNSSGNSAIFWPATEFDLTIKVTALNASGQVLWNRDFTGHGHIEKGRSLIDVPPAKEAATEAFGKLRKALIEDSQFQASAIH